MRHFCEKLRANRILPIELTRLLRVWSPDSGFRDQYARPCAGRAARIVQTFLLRKTGKGESLQIRRHSRGKRMPTMFTKLDGLANNTCSIALAIVTIYLAAQIIIYLTGL
jgi:hypothetical protein